MSVIGMILAFGVGLLILYVLGMLLVVPMKWIGKLILNSLIGFVVLLIINFFGQFLFGFSIAVNFLNALIVGVFGVPGALLLIIFTLLL
ncbi:MAG: pro-sigmaK processing inhibitor BofA family protein [Clostridiales bacterium]|jgi:inhibitor of the pro-sigma K processing machinery|nr:pro-sigmaK processing inhibitor BofA family protein [Clostridiales bacterium]